MNKQNMSSILYVIREDSLKAGFPREGINPLGSHQSKWVKVSELEAGQEIAVPKSDMFMFWPSDYPVMDKHYKYYQTEDAKNTQHNDHFSSPFSTTRIKNNIARDANNAQNMTFCGNDSLAKNSPAKYPAIMILAKSPTSFAMDSLDFELSHFIYTIKCITGFITCQGILGGERNRSVNGGITSVSLRGAAGDEAISVGIASLLSVARNDDLVISPVD